MKKKLPWYHIGCHDGGCPKVEAGPLSGNSPESGGYTAFTLREEDKQPMLAASLQPYEIKVGPFPQKPLKASYDIRHQSEVQQKKAACYVVPDTTNIPIGNLQETTTIGKTLKIFPECGPNETSPSASGWNCRTDLPELASETTNAGGQDFADNQIFTDDCKTDNAWKPCHSDVIDRAKKACVDPLLALAIWLHETGASNYKCSAVFHSVPETDIQDFGINVASVAPPHNFTLQLNGFLGTAAARTEDIKSICSQPAGSLLDFWAMYWKGERENGVIKCFYDYPVETQNEIRADVDYIQRIYSALGGGALPDTPMVSCEQ